MTDTRAPQHHPLPSQPAERDERCARLKPCPFCGGDAYILPNGGGVRCASCGAHAFGPKWNTRALPQGTQPRDPTLYESLYECFKHHGYVGSLELIDGGKITSSWIGKTGEGSDVKIDISISALPDTPAPQPQEIVPRLVSKSHERRVDLDAMSFDALPQCGIGIAPELAAHLDNIEDSSSIFPHVPEMLHVRLRALKLLIDDTLGLVVVEENVIANGARVLLFGELHAVRRKLLEFFKLPRKDFETCDCLDPAHNTFTPAPLVSGEMTHHDTVSSSQTPAPQPQPLPAAAERDGAEMEAVTQARTAAMDTVDEERGNRGQHEHND